jgi:uncharacterized protein (TIGR00251 family)
MNKTILQIKVIPSSSVNKIAGKFVDEKNRKYYKINIKAPPEDGKANQELVKFLAKELKIKKSQITIISGETARMKLVEIEKDDAKLI